MTMSESLHRRGRGGGRNCAMAARPAALSHRSNLAYSLRRRSGSRGILAARRQASPRSARWPSPGSPARQNQTRQAVRRARRAVLSRVSNDFFFASRQCGVGRAANVAREGDVSFTVARLR